MRTKTALLDKIAILLFFVLLAMASLCFNRKTDTATTGEHHTFITAGPANELVEN